MNGQENKRRENILYGPLFHRLKTTFVFQKSYDLFDARKMQRVVIYLLQGRLMCLSGIGTVAVLFFSA